MVGSVKQGDEGQLMVRQLGHRRRGLGHLHQGEQAFLHACPTRSGDADERHLAFDRRLDPAHEPLADHGPHRSAEELELETGHHHRHGLDRALHHHHRVGFAGLLVGGDQAIDVTLAVLELQRIHRDHFAADLEAPLGIEQRIEPNARARRRR
jgi:hypothetical protein